MNVRNKKADFCSSKNDGTFLFEIFTLKNDNLIPFYCSSWILYAQT